MWFSKLTGFNEQSPEQVHANLDVTGNIMTSRINGRSWNCGLLETPTLAELRSRVLECKVLRGPLKISELIGDAKSLHADARNSGALFQVASQFNLLEMPSPGVTPEASVNSFSSEFSSILCIILALKVVHLFLP